MLGSLLWLEGYWYLDFVGVPVQLGHCSMVAHVVQRHGRDEALFHQHRQGRLTVQRMPARRHAQRTALSSAAIACRNTCISFCYILVPATHRKPLHATWHLPSVEGQNACRAHVICKAEPAPHLPVSLTICRLRFTHLRHQAIVGMQFACLIRDCKICTPSGRYWCMFPAPICLPSGQSK